MKKQAHLFQSKGDGLGLFDRKNRESNGREIGRACGKWEK